MAKYYLAGKSFTYSYFFWFNQKCLDNQWCDRFKLILCLASYGPNEDAWRVFSCRKERALAVFCFSISLQFIDLLEVFLYFFVAYCAKMMN